MPGSSLWLLPPTDDPLNDVLSSLINQTSKQFNSPHRFLPHVTLTSDISPSKYGSDPQAWLDLLEFPTGRHVKIAFECLGSEHVFFRKLYIQCEKSKGVKQLAKQCRQQVDEFEEEAKALTWVEEQYMPHLSLMYHDCPQVDAKTLATVDLLGINFKGDGDMRGWLGGRVVLVPTDQPIDQWLPIAERAI